MGALLGRITSWLVARPLVYDAVQVAAGSRRCYGRLENMMPRAARQRVLDIGGGTGRTLAILGADASYVCLDLDPQKLHRLRDKYADAQVVQANAGAIPIRTHSFDVALCAFVCHHLPNDVLDDALREMARACHGATLIMEPLWVPGRYVSHLLWHYDQGAYPRTRAALLERVERHFKVEQTDDFSVFHRYVICRCIPKASA